MIPNLYRLGNFPFLLLFLVATSPCLLSVYLCNCFAFVNLAVGAYYCGLRQRK